MLVRKKKVVSQNKSAKSSAGQQRDCEGGRDGKLKKNERRVTGLARKKVFSSVE